MGSAQKKILWIGILGTIFLIFTGVGVLFAPFFLIGVVYYWNKTPEVMMKKALAKSNYLYKKGQVQESVDVLLPFKESKNYEVYSRLGYRYGQLGSYQEAEVYSQYCYDQNPNDLENLYVHSITLFNLKKYKESQEALSILPASAQTEPIFANIIGANYSGMGKEDIAIEIYKKCLGRKQNIDGEEISIAINLAKILIEKKKNADAKKFLLRILAVNPMHEEATELLEKLKKRSDP
jgi:tetratricopeptide (TPR) repeat protein